MRYIIFTIRHAHAIHCLYLQRAMERKLGSYVLWIKSPIVLKRLSER